MDAPHHPSKEEEDLFSVYDAYARVLRTWFVAYGVGGPVLLFTNEALRNRLVASGLATGIGFAFLIGVALQVLLALMNKSALWVCYVGTRCPKHQESWAYRLSNWFAYDFWIDFGIDAVSFLLFAWATYRAFHAIAVVG